MEFTGYIPERFVTCKNCGKKKLEGVFHSGLNIWYFNYDAKFRQKKIYRYQNVGRYSYF